MALETNAGVDGTCRKLTSNRLAQPMTLDAFLDAAFAAKGLGTWHWTQIVTETGNTKMKSVRFEVCFDDPKDQFVYELLGSEKWCDTIVDQWAKQRAFKHDYT